MGNSVVTESSFLEKLYTNSSWHIRPTNRGYGPCERCISQWGSTTLPATYLCQQQMRWQQLLLFNFILRIHKAKLMDLSLIIDFTFDPPSQNHGPIPYGHNIQGGLSLSLSLCIVISPKLAERSSFQTSTRKKRVNMALNTRNWELFLARNEYLLLR